MKKVILLLMMGVLFFTACKNDSQIKSGNDDNTSSSTVNVNDRKTVNKNDNGTELAPLFNPCSLISVDELADIMNISPSQLKIKPTSSSGTFSKSCFLTWENVENGRKNTMFLMLQTDPIPGDFEDWAQSFLEAKINTGDMGYPNSSMPYKYKKIEGIDGLSAYNDELKRVFWKYNKDYVLAIFYNAAFTEKNRKEYAIKIAKIMNGNLAKKLK